MDYTNLLTTARKKIKSRNHWSNQRYGYALLAQIPKVKLMDLGSSVPDIRMNVGGTKRNRL